MNFEITDTIHETDEKYIFEGLLEYNLERMEDKNPRDLGSYLADEAGRSNRKRTWL